jgi:hypothetical protein
MKTTAHRLTIALSKEDLRILTLLAAKLGDTKTQILKRALNYYFYKEACTNG